MFEKEAEKYASDLELIYKKGVLDGKKAMGKLSPLVAMRSVVNLDSSRVRELCAEIYILIDDIVEIVEKAEERSKK